VDPELVTQEDAMPHRSKSAGPEQGSRNPSENPPSPTNSPSYGGGFTESKQSAPNDPGQTPPSEGVDPEITEPFPPDLFRMPVPDRVFSEMPSMSDAALRCLLALIRESFRFDPEASTWMCPERSFSRQEIETATGLSDQGTRNGLADLEEAGWADVDRSGQSYRYALRIGVPSQRYTYVPTALLEEVSDLPSATALRVLLAVLRATWGWTSEEQRSDETASQTAQEQTVHQRWAELATSTLSGLVGCSEPAIREAIGALEEEWISRVQPGHGAYLYRILPGAFKPEGQATGGEERLEENRPENPPSLENPSSSAGASSDAGVPNEITPDRQRNYPPSSHKESSGRDKQNTKPDSEETSSPQADPADPKRKSAVPNPENNSGGEAPDTDLSEFSERKQSLYRKLTNAGVWPDRAKECLRRYSPARIEANFELFRERAPEIDDHGAWLCAAITDGYADFGKTPSSRAFNQISEDSPTGNSSREDRAKQASGSRTGSHRTGGPPEHKQKVSPEEKKRLVRRHEGVNPEHFHRFRHPERPSEKQFLYLDPAKGGPTRKRRAT